MMKSIATLAGAAVVAVAATGASAATLDDVKARGELVCGTNTGLAGFAAPDNTGNWTGLDVDFCRAVASAIFDDPTKVRFVPLSAQQRFTALQNGEVDLLSRNTTWTINRDTALGLNFVGVTFYDGQGFMVKKELDLKSALELGGATVCVQAGTTTELNMADYFQANNLEYNPVVFEKLEDANSAYQQGRCDAYTTDASGLYSVRLALPNPDDHVVLPELISKEPLGPAVRKGDEQWFSVIKWTYFALLNAEELGITQANVEEMVAKADASPEIKRVLGTEEGTKIGTDLGLENDWVVKIIKGTGNYGEIFERNVGQGSALKIDRGVNKLWNKGGLQYGVPIR